MTKMKIHVIMRGQGVSEEFDAVSHKIEGYPGGTYHIFDMGGGRTMFFNDFGIRVVQIDQK